MALVDEMEVLAAFRERLLALTPANGAPAPSTLPVSYYEAPLKQDEYPHDALWIRERVQLNPQEHLAFGKSILYGLTVYEIMAPLANTQLQLDAADLALAILEDMPHGARFVGTNGQHVCIVRATKRTAVPRSGDLSHLRAHPAVLSWYAQSTL